MLKFKEYLDLLAGHSCPRPGDIQHGQWTCEEQQIPIPETADIGGDLETYPGKSNDQLSKSFISILLALQCRLDCNPGYASDLSPLATCVNGNYDT